MLEKTPLGAVASIAPGDLARVIFDDFVGSASEAFLAFGCLLSHFVLKVLLSSLLTSPNRYLVG